MSVLTAAWDGLLLVLAWPNVLIPVLGTLAAMGFALLPGISGTALLAIAIPLTIGWEPLPVVLLFGALVGGATFMGSVTAILLGIPGTAPNAATILDGYPMAQQGRARPAIACAATASALGSTVGIGILIGLVPVASHLVLRMGPPEYLMVSLWGLASTVLALRGSLLKGLVMAGLGLMASFVGLDPVTAEARFTMGTLYLQDGLPLIPVFLGLFAVAEVMDLVLSGRETVSGGSDVGDLTGDAKEGMRAVFENFGLFLKSSVIGTTVGFLPGLGGTVAGFVAYGEAARSAGPGSRFGRGDIRGVLAPEAANDAKDGGSLLPALALGIPASAGTALLLSALQIHGVRPGVDLMSDRLPLVFALIWSLFFSNWLTSLLGFSLVGPLARLTLVRTTRLAPMILALSAVGILAFQTRLADLATAFAFGLCGTFMKRYDWPRVAFVIALVLGPLFEQNLHLTLTLHRLGRINLWSHPAVLVLSALLLVTVAFAWFRSFPGRNR